MRPIDLILIVSVLVPARVHGQDARDAWDRPISVVWNVGQSFIGPGSNLVNQLLRAGYRNRTLCPAHAWVCGGPSQVESAPGGASALTLRYAMTSELAVGAGISWTELGGGSGYRWREKWEEIRSYWDVSTVWAAAFWMPVPELRLGGGPALYGLSDEGGRNEVSKLGLIGEYGIEYPSNRRFLLDVAVRLHVVPSEDVVYRSQLSETDVKLSPNWTHVQVLAGIGVRL